MPTQTEWSRRLLLKVALEHTHTEREGYQGKLITALFPTCVNILRPGENKLTGQYLYSRRTLLEDAQNKLANHFHVKVNLATQSSHGRTHWVHTESMYDVWYGKGLLCFALVLSACAALFLEDKKKRGTWLESYRSDPTSDDKSQRWISC